METRATPSCVVSPLTPRFSTPIFGAGAVELALQQVGIALARVETESGCETVADANCDKRRVALARAFALRPPILLADEPTGNLDSATGAVVLELILTLHREENATMVLVTHEQSLADSADRRIVMRDGLVET